MMTINEKAETISVLKDIIKPLPTKVQNFALELHKHSLEKGLKCVLDNKQSYVRFRHIYKSKEVWNIVVTLNNDYRIGIMANWTHYYQNLVKKFHLDLQEIIEKGYGCEKKRGLGRCQKGCQGFRIILDNSILNLSKDIEIWLDRELECLQNKVGNVKLWKGIDIPVKTIVQKHGSFKDKAEVIQVSCNGFYNWAVLTFKLSKYTGRKIEIGVSMQVWLEAPAEVKWQINSPDYPIIAGETTKLSAKRWHTINGKKTIVVQAHNALYLSSYSFNNVTAYLADLKIAIDGKIVNIK